MSATGILTHYQKLESDGKLKRGDAQKAAIQGNQEPAL